MSKQVVNTEQFKSSVSKLKSTNININRQFQTLQNESRKLENCWNGRAGEQARTTMYQLFSNNEARSNVLENYVNILKQLIDPGYEDVEVVNTKLADKFK